MLTAVDRETWNSPEQPCSPPQSFTRTENGRCRKVGALHAAAAASSVLMDEKRIYRANLCQFSERVEVADFGDDLREPGRVRRLREVTFGRVRRNISRTCWAARKESATVA